MARTRAAVSNAERLVALEQREARLAALAQRTAIARTQLRERIVRLRLSLTASDAALYDLLTRRTSP